MIWLANILILLSAVVMMEVAATLAHKYIMHGWGWGWHLSHHEPHDGGFELNDLYALIFAALAVLMIYLGVEGLWPLQWVGAGVTVYGVLYFMVHDGLVHQRWPFRYIPRRGYLKRLYMAHRLHHAVRGKEGCVSFGFLYAPPLPRLQQALRQQHDQSRRQR
ncbi:sterol desaturase family protein [Pantoea sp. At-9b]|uniref:sterol desaturase family protein n=1 Tax=Pantoea sp. (strain At-9b) TaxID=592316 RepID=UPI0001B3FD84|nr:sterol desaturase family protein [Pantoea sp. At-9b]ADU71421.1 fatty acid hydroxylase [Pantoea sp. At-9b]